MTYLEQVQADLESWFREPLSEVFCGVLVYQRIKPLKNGKNRIGLAVPEYMRDQYLSGGATLPYTSTPNNGWLKAPCIGFATTLEDAYKLITG